MHLIEHFVANMIYLLYYSIQGRGKVLLIAKRDAILGLPKALKKRKSIQKNRKTADRYLLENMQHGWLQPYLLGYKLRRILKQTYTEKS